MSGKTGPKLRIYHGFEMADFELLSTKYFKSFIKIYGSKLCILRNMYATQFAAKVRRMNDNSGKLTILSSSVIWEM